MAQGQMEHKYSLYFRIACVVCCNCRVNWKDIIWHTELEIFTVWLYRKCLLASACNTALYGLFYFYLISVRSLLLVSERRTKNRGKAGEKELRQIKPYCVLTAVLLNCLLSLLRNNNNNKK